jgi:hypothetical protein
MSQKVITEEEVYQSLMVHDHLKKAAQEKVEIVGKKFAIDKKRTESMYADMKEKEAQKKAIDEMVLGDYSDEYYENLVKENDEYMELARTAPCFLNEGFLDKVPFFAKNLILIGAKSGQGKSTLVSNLAFLTVKQNKKVLVITNEERVTDVFNRITCLIRGWRYANHSSFTEEQKETFSRNFKVLGQRVHVVADNFNGKGGTTTTLEGIRGILKKAHEGGEEYGAVLIDYYQNIKSSTEFIHLDEWKLLDKVGDVLEEYRLKLNFPIVLLAQLKPNTDEKEDVKYRIERSKSIYNRATCVIEIIANYDEGTSSFIIHKSRFNSAVGKVITCKYVNGLYAYWDQEKEDKEGHDSFMEKAKERNKLYRDASEGT